MFNLSRVGFDAAQLGVQHGAQLDVLANQPLKQLLRASHNGIEIDDLRLKHLLATEGEKLPRQQGGTIACFLDFFDTLALGVIQTQTIQHESGVAQDDSQ